MLHHAINIGAIFMKAVITQLLFQILDDEKNASQSERKTCNGSKRIKQILREIANGDLEAITKHDFSRLMRRWTYDESRTNH